MSLNYGLLRGRVVEFGREDNDPKSPHFQIIVEAAGTRWRVPVNVLSQDGSEVLFVIPDPIPAHPLLSELEQAAEGFTPNATHHSGLALDYVREPLFNPAQFRHLPFSGPGANDDLQDAIEVLTQHAIAQNNAELFAFGAKFDATNNPLPVDKQFNTRAGVHDIHMNQGNPKGKFSGDNGVFQDGGLIFRFPDSDHFAGVFLAFQTQSFHTDDATGQPLPGPAPEPGIPVHDPRVHIMAGLVNPSGPDPSQETVTLLNPGADRIDIGGWSIADRQDKRDTFPSGLLLEAGESKVILLTGNGAQLSNKGGVIRLLDATGAQVDRVSYTHQQAAVEGRTIVF